MPLSKVKEKEFLSRPMGCKGIGFSFVRCKPGEGATYVHRHKVQEEVFIALKGDGTIILDGKRIKMPEGTIVRVGPTVCGRWETTQNQTLSLWFWAPSRQNFPWAEGPFWATGFPIEERYRVGRKRERNRPCRALSRKMCRFGGTSDLRILGKRNIVSLIQSDRSHPRRV
jgi:hypothetical protein